MLFLFIFSASFFFLAIRNLAPQRWLMRLGVACIPLPWIASELGWFVAEYGRQPWTISSVLPTFLSVSSLDASTVYASLGAFIAFYTALFVVEMYLMLKYIRLGPGSLGTGRYFGEAGALAPGASGAPRPAGAGE
jgi:cytochrome d ubiquinol oxidase subunit I